jgi:hypothetical protein
MVGGGTLLSAEMAGKKWVSEERAWGGGKFLDGHLGARQPTILVVNGPLPLRTKSIQPSMCKQERVDSAMSKFDVKSAVNKPVRTVVPKQPVSQCDVCDQSNSSGKAWGEAVSAADKASRQTLQRKGSRVGPKLALHCQRSKTSLKKRTPAEAVGVWPLALFD